MIAIPCPFHATEPILGVLFSSIVDTGHRDGWESPIPSKTLDSLPVITFSYNSCFGTIRHCPSQSVVAPGQRDG